MPAARLVVEGVSGSGKSQALRRLRRLPAFRGALVLTERATFGELLGELRRKPMTSDEFLRRLTACLKKIERLPRNRACLIERFHPSYYAVVPDWSLYRDIDRRLKTLGFRLGVLRVPKTRLARRSLDRADRSPRWREGMSEYFGGRAAALRALRLSQRRRLALARRTALPFRAFDTRDRLWPRLAADLAAFATSR
jgi:hypothetical protein